MYTPAIATALDLNEVCLYLSHRYLSYQPIYMYNRSFSGLNLPEQIEQCLPDIKPTQTIYLSKRPISPAEVSSTHPHIPKWPPTNYESDQKMWRIFHTNSWIILYSFDNEIDRNKKTS